MCGLVGVVGDIFNKEKDVFKDLLNVDVLRGSHSTGIASVGVSRQPIHAKEPWLPTDLLESKQGRTVMQASSMLLMGHNRYATVGKINKAGAHPFEHGSIIGMHNGTLRNWRTHLEDPNNFDVDSECLIYTLDKRGVAGTFEDLDGAFAVTWYDGKTNTFNMIRNSERPLYTQYSKDVKKLFYASEDWMIAACADRRGVPLQDKVYLVPEGVHLSWELPRHIGQTLPKVSARRVQLRPFVQKSQHVYTSKNHTPANPPVNQSTPASNPSSGKVSGASTDLAVRKPDNGTNGNKYSHIDRVPLKFKDNYKGTIDAYTALLGKDVLTYAVDFQELNPQTGEGHLVCMGLDKPNHPFRVRVQKYYAAKLMEHMGCVKGKVSGFIHPAFSKGKKQDDGYLLLDPTTLAMTDDPTEGTSTRLESYGPKGELLHEIEFDKLTKHGCAMCSANLMYGDELFWRNNEVLCEDCHADMEDFDKLGKEDM